MATVRLIIVLLLLGMGLLLAVQNTSPALSLVFLGGQTVALPLSFWLLLAIALGALTTFFFTVLLGADGGRGSRSKAYKYRPQPFYEPAGARTAPRDAAQDVSPERSSDTAASQSSRRRPARDNRSADNPTASNGTWQAWTDLQSPAQWNDWEATSQAPRNEGVSPSAGAGMGRWFFGNRKTAEQERVNQSWQELSDDWGDLEHRDYRARGVSPVDENLEDINQGWDTANQPPHDFEMPQSPQRIYQDGSIYSYSYRDRHSTGQKDNIYAPPDDEVYGDQGFDRDAYVDLSEPEGYGAAAEPDTGPADYGAGGDEGEDLGEPEVAEDGVVDADYRVIIPPSPPVSAESTAEPKTAEGEDSWDGDDDDWNEAEDVLTP